ncbi:YraN family protein [Patescibacteria group bacterium]|nr:YraN family protein [Patescibacteria group bacterium]
MSSGGKRIGILGEEVAARYLANHGYQIIVRNYRQRVGEIDIVVLDHHRAELVFCEVKARTGISYGVPAEAISAYKQYKVIQTIQHFRQEYSALSDQPYRFDVLAIMVDLSNREAEVEHLKNVFIQ